MYWGLSIRNPAQLKATSFQSSGRLVYVLADTSERFIGTRLPVSGSACCAVHLAIPLAKRTSSTRASRATLPAWLRRSASL
jgi:hypothetical protein